MKFYKTRSKTIVESIFKQFQTQSRKLYYKQRTNLPIKKFAKPIKKTLMRPTNYAYFFLYFSIISYLSLQGLTKATSLIPGINQPSLVYQLKALRKLRKQKRIFHKKKWIYGAPLHNQNVLIERDKTKSWGLPKNYRKNVDTLKNKYVLIPTQNSKIENFVRYSLTSGQRTTVTQLVTVRGNDRFFGKENISIIYPPLHPRILRLYLKDKTTSLQQDKQILQNIHASWYEKVFETIFFKDTFGRLSFLMILNLWTLLCFCIFIQQIIEGFCFTLVNDGDQKPLIDDDPFSDYILPSNLILPENNTKNFFNGVPTGVATNELKPLIQKLQAQPRNIFVKVFQQRTDNITVAKGIIFVGGFEKGGSHFAQALAGEAKIPFIRIPASQFLLSNIQEGLLLMRIIFYYAKTMSPAMLHIDDIDIFCGLRSSLDLTSKTKKSSLFSLDYTSKSDDAKTSKSLSKSNFTKAFQAFKKQQEKSYKHFISFSLENNFPVVETEKIVDSKFDFEHNSNDPSKTKQSLSEDDLTTLLNQLLIELDGAIPTQASLITTATAEKITTLEPALIRPGRLSTHIEFDYLYNLDREKIIKSLLFKHKTKTTIPWYLFASQLKDFQYISIKQIVENAIYYSQVFSKTPNLIELNSLLFAKQKFLLIQELQLKELKNTTRFNLKSKFIEDVTTEFVQKNKEVNLETLPTFINTDMSLIPYLYQNFDENKVNAPQTTYQVLNKLYGLFLLYISENLWNQQQVTENTNQYQSVLYLLTRNLIQDNVTISDSKTFHYLSAFLQFNRSTEINHVDKFTDLKTLNLIDVFGNMQFISQWKQTNELDPSDIEDLELLIIAMRYLMIEYHAYLSYGLYKQLAK